MPQTPVTPLTTSYPITSAYEYTVACVQQTAACSGTASWAVRSTHGLHCPQFGHICDACKVYLEASWTDALLSGTGCANCHAPVMGALEEHLSFLHL